MRPKGDARETDLPAIRDRLSDAFAHAMRDPAEREQDRLDLEATRAELARLEAEVARLESQQLDALKHAGPGPVNDWPGLAAAMLIKDPPPALGAGTPTSRLRAAIDDGWIVRETSSETVDALRAFDRDVLWRVLHLDADPATAARYRRDLKGRRDRVASLVRRQRSFRLAVEGFSADAKERRRFYAAPGETLQTATDAIATLEREFILCIDDAEIGCRMLASFVSDIERKTAAHGRAQFRGRQLRWLFDALCANAAKARPWTHRRFAKLILSSTKDFVVPPCPRLVEAYAGDEVGLSEMIKKQIAKAETLGKVGKIRPRASTRNRQSIP